MVCRGRSEYVYSDNSHKFVQADQEVVELWEQRCVEVACGLNCILWEHSTPYAPHQESVFERMVVVAKCSMKVVLFQAHFMEDEFNTALVMVEGILNSQPLRVPFNNPFN